MKYNLQMQIEVENVAKEVLQKHKYMSIPAMIEMYNLGKAAKQSSAIVWVKASERLPKEGDLHAIKYRSCLSVAYHEKTYWYLAHNHCLLSLADKEIEWLDESNTSAIVESEEKNYEPEVRNTNEAK